MRPFTAILFVRVNVPAMEGPGSRWKYLSAITRNGSSSPGQRLWEFCLCKRREEGHYHIGGPFIIPDYQRKWIGASAISYMKSICPDWKKITSTSPIDKKENVRFYIENAVLPSLAKNWTEV